MDYKNDKQKPSGSVTTKAEDKIVTDSRTTVKPLPNQQIRKRYMNSALSVFTQMTLGMYAFLYARYP
ncbi:MAG: hypothetical protein WA364_13630 [Candidatus Nitrosopolaris sp.]|jgi:hypothetical protein